MADLPELLDELDAARARFHDALDHVDADLVMAPGVVGDWSVRDLVVHVAAWCEHGSAAMDLATSGRGDEFTYSKRDTDAMNRRFAAEGSSLSPHDALAREETAYAAFRERIGLLDPAMLDRRLGNDDTVEAVIRYDGPEHYDEHAAHLRAWFGPDGDEDIDGP